MFPAILLIYCLVMSMSQVRHRTYSPREQASPTSLQTRLICRLLPPTILSRWKKNGHQPLTVLLQKNICRRRRKRRVNSMLPLQTRISLLPLTTVWPRNSVTCTLPLQALRKEWQAISLQKKLTTQRSLVTMRFPHTSTFHHQNQRRRLLTPLTYLQTRAMLLQHCHSMRRLRNMFSLLTPSIPPPFLLQVRLA